MKADKTDKMLAIEEREGKPIEQILQEYYKRYGVVRAAEKLGLGSPATFYRWCLRLGLEVETSREVRQT